MFFKSLKLLGGHSNFAYASRRYYQHSSVYVSTCQNVFYNLAMEDWIYKNIKFDHRVLMMLWRNKPCVVIGRHQNPWAECHLGLAEQQGVDVARRNSGGGTVYHDMGNINITFFTSRNKYNRKENLELVARTMNEFGLNIEVNDRDDLINKGYKVSGTAAKLGKDVAYHHCTLLLDTDIEAMQTVLHPSMPGIESKATESVKSPCQNLLDVCHHLNYNKIVEDLSANYLNKYGNGQAKFTYVDPTNERHFPKLYESYQDLKSWQWRFAKTPKFTIKRLYMNGGTTLEIAIEVHKGLIDDVDVTLSGETSTTLNTDISAVSTQLFGTKFWPAEVEACLARVNIAEKNRWVLSCVMAMCDVSTSVIGKDGSSDVGVNLP